MSKPKCFFKKKKEAARFNNLPSEVKDIVVDTTGSVICSSKEARAKVSFEQMFLKTKVRIRNQGSISEVYKTDSLTENRQNPKEHRRNSVKKRTLKDNFPIETAGSNFEFFSPAVGVSITEGKLKKDGGNDFAKLYNQLTKDDYLRITRNRDKFSDSIPKIMRTEDKPARVERKVETEVKVLEKRMRIRSQDDLAKAMKSLELVRDVEGMKMNNIFKMKKVKKSDEIGFDILKIENRMRKYVKPAFRKSFQQY